MDQPTSPIELLENQEFCTWAFGPGKLDLDYLIADCPERWNARHQQEHFLDESERVEKTMLALAHLWEEELSRRDGPS